MENNKYLTAISNGVKAKVSRHEYLFIIWITLVLAMTYTNVQYAGTITTLVLSSLAIIYILSAFATHDEEDVNMFDVFLYKLSTMASSVAIIGILFTLHSWPNANPMLIVGALSLSICIVFILMEKHKRSNLTLFSTAYVIRLVAIIFFIVVIKYG